MKHETRNKKWPVKLGVGMVLAISMLLQLLPLPALAADLPIDEVDTGYAAEYTELFTEKPATLQDGISDDTHYAKWADGKIAVYRPGDGGSNYAALTLPETYTQDGLRLAMTVFENDAESAGTAHSRMKVFFLNSSNQRAHQIFVQRRSEGLVLLDSTSSLISSGLHAGVLGEPLRIEMEFDFTNQTIRYRTALLVQDVWNWSAWSAEKGTNPADGGTILDGLRSIRFSNEYGTCNITVDDLRVSVPESDDPDTPPTDPEPDLPIDEVDTGYAAEYTERFAEKPADL